MSPKDAIKYVDENTIGVIVVKPSACFLFLYQLTSTSKILGSTYTGAFEDVKGMSDLCTSYLRRV